MIEFKPTGYCRIGSKQVFTLKCSFDIQLEQVKGQQIKIDNNEYQCIDVERSSSESLILKGEKIGLVVELKRIDTN